jgi:RNA polymerase sigma-70 factor (ECF subfamily)
MPVIVMQRSALEDDAIGILISRVQTGDMAALGDVFRLFSGDVFAIAYAVSGSKATAEDTTQDVFLALPGALRPYEHRSTGGFRRWLTTIAYRIALKRVRENRSRREIPLSAASRLPGAGSGDDSVLDLVVLERSIAGLPLHFRSVLILRVAHGMTHREVANTLGISEGASQVRFHRALRLLRHVLSS